MLRIALLWVLCGLAIAWPGLAGAGGNIHGTVSYQGASVREEFPTTKLPNGDYCATLAQQKPEVFLHEGKTRLLQTIEVSPNGALKDAIVAVQDVIDPAFLASYQGTTVQIEECEFHPYTSVVVEKRNFHVLNLDPTDHRIAQNMTVSAAHNPHGMEVQGSNSRTLFNIGLAQKGAQLNKPVVLRKRPLGSSLLLLCDQHPYMQAWFLPITNPYYAVTANAGTFEITNVPAGHHKVKAWHPRAGMMEKEIVVPESGDVTVLFDIPAK
ncbi:MAG: hypothetical protein KF814_05390 [Nitrospiraceae bacterium]|nr:hypothetical protein [Nitrospiraceae bacterium]